MTVSPASRVLSRELLEAQAAVNTATTAAIAYLADIASFLAGRTWLCAHPGPNAQTLPQASHKKTPRRRGVFFALDLLSASRQRRNGPPPWRGRCGRSCA